MKRFRVMAAALCAVVLLCGFSVPAYDCIFRVMYFERFLFSHNLLYNCLFPPVILALFLLRHYNKPIGTSPTLAIMQRKNPFGGYYESIIC